MSKISKIQLPSLKIDFTVSGGMDDKLYELVKGFCDSYDVCLLCKEGGDGETHPHAHAVIQTKKRSDNVKRTLKKMYCDNGYGWSRASVMIKVVVGIEGALSYVYKEKKVILCKGYILANIKEWSSIKKVVKIKRVTCYLTAGNAVDKIIDYAEEQGIKIDDYQTFNLVLKDMAVARYRLSMVLRNIRPIMIDVLAHFGDTVHLDAFLDLNCNMFA